MAALSPAPPTPVPALVAGAPCIYRWRSKVDVTVTYIRTAAAAAVLSHARDHSLAFIVVVVPRTRCIQALEDEIRPAGRGPQASESSAATPIESGSVPNLRRHGTYTHARIEIDEVDARLTDRPNGSCASPGSGVKARSGADTITLIIIIAGIRRCRCRTLNAGRRNAGPKGEVRALLERSPRAVLLTSSKLQAPTAPAAGVLARRAFADESRAPFVNARALGGLEPPPPTVVARRSPHPVPVPAAAKSQSSESRHARALDQPSASYTELRAERACGELASHGFGCACAFEVVHTTCCRRSSCANRAAAATLRLFDFCRMLHCVARVMRTTVGRPCGRTSSIGASALRVAHRSPGRAASGRVFPAHGRRKMRLPSFRAQQQ
ncbi:hypothetical protein OH77DRAFT_860924 [Trametes cingulata]|nr:hypothetical protein OH77DRAFT_860924 [Trametes cingulata]